MKKITLTKRLESNGKAIVKEIQIELPDGTHRIDIEEAMFRVLSRGAWMSPSDIPGGTVEPIGRIPADKE